MKVALTSSGSSLNSPLDERFGRADTLIIYDLETGDYTCRKNDLESGEVQGAGIKTAKNIIDLGVEAVVSGHIGPNAFRVLKKAGIKVYPAHELTVQQAVDALKDGKFRTLDSADVDGHHGR